MKKILIVDDATFMQKVTSGILSIRYRVLCASSGQEAVRMYEEEQPDLIISDLYMPDMTGLELQRTLQDKYERVVPFVFITSDEREESESRGLEAGAIDYIRKPFKPEVLLRRIDNAMRQIENAEQIRGLRTVLETDPMTGLLNKAFAQKTLMEVCQKESGVLMMVDLDSFKLVNDLYGHAMGDKVLIRFGEILRCIIRTSDVAGRIGGDEFIVFCRDVRDEELIAQKSKQINEMLLEAAKELMGADMNIPLGASVGAVIAPDEGTDYPTLSEKADKALYQVKQNGKHGYAVFREHALSEHKTGSVSNTMDSIRMILGERNRQRGAYALGFENFRTVYRFLVRTIENYHRRMELVLYTLSGDAQAVELFGEILGRSLRRSDVYTQNSPNQYLVLLLEIQPDDINIVLNRIQTNWDKDGTGDQLRIACESVPLEI
ncbi:MAG: diguanylate cyclase [Oscillospiraceae bacterium]|nr:diguanylate cyclase [Oscillospiraceae bacterium]